MRCRSSNPRREVKQEDVFPRISRRRHFAALALGSAVSARPLCPASVLQLLVGLTVTNDHPLLDAGQLPRTLPRERLPANSFSIDVDCSPGHDLFPAAGLSIGSLPVVL